MTALLSPQTKCEDVAMPPEHWHQWVLSNGLKLVVIEDHRQPVVAYRLVVQAGAGDEQADESGYAHLLEHMMFQGSRHVLPGDYARLMESAGGVYNASTDYDRTDYFAVLPSHWAQRALWLEADRFGEPLLGEAQVNSQRDAVLEEKALRVDNMPYARAVTEYLTSALAGTRYGHLLTGSKQSLQRADRQRLLRFYSRHYAPERMVLAVVGDVAPNLVLDWVRQTFGAVQRRASPTAPQPPAEFLLR
jgi:zinc protease